MPSIVKEYNVSEYIPPFSRIRSHKSRNRVKKGSPIRVESYLWKSGGKSVSPLTIAEIARIYVAFIGLFAFETISKSKHARMSDHRTRQTILSCIGIKEKNNCFVRFHVNFIILFYNITILFFVFVFHTD